MSDTPIRVETHAIQEIESAAVVQQLDAAHKYPQHRTREQRSEIVAGCIAECASTYDDAMDCHYSLPRGGKSIEGPSIHMMRSVGNRFGNIMAAARVIAIEDRYVRAQGAAWDMETNVRKTVEVQRRITDRNGKRYDDDMVQVTAQAALAIAERNALKAVIPKSIWGPVYAAVQRRLTEEAGVKDDLGAIRRKVAAWFAARGVPEEAMLAKVGAKRLGDLDRDRLKALGGIKTRIDQEDTTIEQEFPDVESSIGEPRRDEESPPDPKSSPRDRDATERSPTIDEISERARRFANAGGDSANQTETKSEDDDYAADYELFADMWRSLSDEQQGEVREALGYKRMPTKPPRAKLEEAIRIIEEMLP